MAEAREAVMYITAIKLPAGKLAAQVAHAAVECFRGGKRNGRRYRARQIWLRNPAKIVLRMDNMDQAAALLDAADRLSLSRAVICDAGRTVVKAGTVTAVAVGPVFRDEDGPWTAMKLY